jgi:hypothetical protein
MVIGAGASSWNSVDALPSVFHQSSELVITNVGERAAREIAIEPIGSVQSSARVTFDFIQLLAGNGSREEVIPRFHGHNSPQFISDVLLHLDMVEFARAQRLGAPITQYDVRIPLSMSYRDAHTGEPLSDTFEFQLIEAEGKWFLHSRDPHEQTD